MTGIFELRKSTNGQFHFSLKARNGEIILTSEMYVTKSSAEAGIASIRMNCQKNDRYAKMTSLNGKFYFMLKASNNQIIGISQMYYSESSRNVGIESVKINGTTMSILDNT